MKRFLLTAGLLAGVYSSVAAATLNEGQERALTAYLTALAHGNYGAAYALLAPVDQRYYRSVSNFASVYTADRLELKSFKISGAPVSVESGTVATVQENISVIDPARQTTVSFSAPAHYGIVSENGSYRIRDPRHPWKSFVPAGAATTHDKITVTVRKVSFYPDRIELVVNFANAGDGAVTVFPYGRSVARADDGRIYSVVDSNVAARLDNELFLGLRLPASAQYTGIVGFRFGDPSLVPGQLAVTISPVIREGSDAPLEIALPPIKVPG